MRPTTFNVIAMAPAVGVQAASQSILVIAAPPVLDAYTPTSRRADTNSKATNESGPVAMGAYQVSLDRERPAGNAGMRRIIES